MSISSRLVEAGLLPAVYRTVEAAFPEEGCGFVFEGPDRVLSVVPTQNRATQLHEIDPESYPRDGRDYFEPDMKPWLQAAREGHVARVIFHSHPDDDAYFSETDRRSAVFVDDDDGSVLERHPGVVHLVVSVTCDPTGGPPRARHARLFAFSSRTEQFEPIAAYGADGQLARE